MSNISSEVSSPIQTSKTPDILGFEMTNICTWSRTTWRLFLNIKHMPFRIIGRVNNQNRKLILIFETDTDTCISAFMVDQDFRDENWTLVNAYGCLFRKEN